MMKSKPLQTVTLPVEEADEMEPKVPTNVVGSYKGGALKTALAVALAERLALAGLQVVLLACDGQEDARKRLGLGPRDPSSAKVSRGTGSITIIGLSTQQAAQLIYRHGFAQLGQVDTVVVDTPPMLNGGRLPGALLFATTDGDDATQNLCTMLRLTPKNTEVVLVRYHALNSRPDHEEWAREVDAIETAVGRHFIYLREPMPRSDPVKKALDSGQSVWELPRRGRTLEFLSGIEALAGKAWSRIRSGSLPARPRKAPSYIPGWDEDDD